MTSMEVVAGVDTGTSGCKVTIVNEFGRILSSAFSPYTTYGDYAGWSEQDPGDWVRAAHAGLSQALARMKRHSERAELRALAFSAPHHVAVLCDEKMRPLRRSIMWTDQRSAVVAQRTAGSHGNQIWEQCGNVSAATWTLPQLQWLRQQEPGVLSATRRVLFMKDFVRHSFCAGHVTDHIDASGTLLYNPARRSWVPDLVKLAGLDERVLPQVVQPEEVVGRIDEGPAATLGVRRDVSILADSADTAVELLAAGCVSPGDHALKLATAGNVSHVEQQRSATADAISYPYLIPGTYYLNSATNSAAASFEWLARILGGAPAVGHDFFQQLDREAAQVSPGSDGLTFHPYLNGERAPHWNPALRASFVGLTYTHGRGHLVRAVMEGVAMSMREARGPQGPALSAAALIGGGARSSVWSGIMAAVFRADLRVPEVADSSLGGALLAANHLGWLPSLHDAPSFPVVGSAEYVANNGAADIYDQVFERYQRIQRALMPGYEADHRP